MGFDKKEEPKRLETILDKFAMGNFRGFKDFTKIEFAPLTILTGTNSSGKSSVLKALQLLNANLGDLGFLDFAEGDHKLGNFELALNKDTEEKYMYFCFYANHPYFDKPIGIALSYYLDETNPLIFGQLKEIELYIKKSDETILLFSYEQEYVNYEYLNDIQTDRYLQYLVDYNRFCKNDILIPTPKEFRKQSMNLFDYSEEGFDVVALIYDLEDEYEKQKKIAYLEAALPDDFKIYEKVEKFIPEANTNDEWLDWVEPKFEREENKREVSFVDNNAYTFSSHFEDFSTAFILNLPEPLLKKKLKEGLARWYQIKDEIDYRQNKLVSTYTRRFFGVRQIDVEEIMFPTYGECEDYFLGVLHNIKQSILSKYNIVDDFSLTKLINQHYANFIRKNTLFLSGFNSNSKKLVNDTLHEFDAKMRNRRINEESNEAKISRSEPQYSERNWHQFTTPISNISSIFISSLYDDFRTLSIDFDEDFDEDFDDSFFGDIIPPLIEAYQLCFSWSDVEYIDFVSDNLLRVDDFNTILKNIKDRIIKKIETISLFENLEPVRAKQQRVYSKHDSEFGRKLFGLAQNTFEYGKYKYRNGNIEFINKWLVAFGIGNELKIKVEEQGTGISVLIDDRPLADLGYGVTQIVSLLIKVVGSKGILYLEEPETNLHPKLQSKLADMLIDVAKTFHIQFIVETHSEYLIRKLQYWVAKKEFETKDVAIYYFHNPKDERPKGEPPIKRINILPDGRLNSAFGTGFYDESARLMTAILTGENLN